ncbi:MAG: hypothetical protein JW981_08425, partial [Anaerolineae bacterium]|nr:hypothetical protein [Anaerolineae bacterium]
MKLEERQREEHIIFGTYTNDTLRLVNYRAHHQGLQHNAHIIPYDPKPGQPVTLRVVVNSDLSFKELICFYTNDGSIPTLDSPRISLLCVKPSWDPLIWAYVRQWACTLPPQPEGTLVRYRIGGRLPDGTWCFADWPPADSAVLAATRRYFGDDTAEVVVPEPGIGHTFTYSVDNFSPPAWARNAVIYQVFVDRFDPGKGGKFAG